MNAIVLPHSAMKLLFKYTLRLWVEAHKLIQFSLFLAFLSSALGSYCGVYATYNNVHMIVACEVMIAVVSDFQQFGKVRTNPEHGRTRRVPR
jgi:hypothetical protein